MAVDNEDADIPGIIIDSEDIQINVTCYYSKQ